MATERGTRGKYAEGEVRKLLTKLNSRADFAWHRMPDARAARSALAAQPADFIVANAGKVLWWEVKETKIAHRLPHDKVSQHPTLAKFRLAGMDYIVIVFHTEERAWRVVPGRWLDTHRSGASWVIDEFDAYGSLEDALVGEGVL